MSTASGDEATTAPEAADSVSVVSASEKAPDDESSKQSTAAEEEVVKAPEPEETPSPEKIEPPEDDNEEDHHEEDGETLEENEDGDLSEDRSSIAGSSAGSQVPETEREEGDGQEVEDADKKDKKLDHDEDRRDPQYIPKRGVFYEHDDRTLEEDSDVKKEPPREPRRSKAEHIERWGHDMYNEDEQSPKTTQELVDIYGYDIRKEEGPPKARRRRRYGKGPNKYQRSWEDEQAYNKTPTRGGYRGGQKRPPRNFVNRDEDFPTLSGTEPVVGHKEDPDSPRPPHRDHEPKLPSKQPEENRLTKEEIKANHHSLPKKIDPFKGSLPVRGRGISRRGRSSESVQPFTKSQAHGPNHVPDKHPKSGSTADEDIATLAQHFSNAVINVDKNIAPIRSQSEPPAEDRPRHSGDRPHRHEGHKHQDKLHGPPSQEKQAAPLDQPSTKSKRYSTQRQRPTSGSQVPPASAPPPPPTAQQMPNAPNYLPPQQGYYPPPQHGICPPETTPHIAAPPAQFQPGVQMVTFLPTVPPPPTNTFQPPPNIYVPPTPYIPPPPIVQPGPAEVYQGGVTYYSTQSQPVARAPPSRRVKLAIPIVAPDSSQPIQ